MTNEEALKWLDDIEKYLKRGDTDGVWVLTDEDAEALSILRSALAPVTDEGRESLLGQFDNIVASSHDGYTPADKEFKPCWDGCREQILRVRSILAAPPAPRPKITTDWAEGEYEAIEDGDITKEEFYEDLRKVGVVVVEGGMT